MHFKCLNFCIGYFNYYYLKVQCSYIILYVIKDLQTIRTSDDYIHSIIMICLPRAAPPAAPRPELRTKDINARARTSFSLKPPYSLRGLTFFHRNGLAIVHVYRFAIIKYIIMIL